MWPFKKKIEPLKHPDVDLCRKCGVSINREHIPLAFFHLDRVRYNEKKNVLVRHCWQCGYSWDTPPVDERRGK